MCRPGTWRLSARRKKFQTSPRPQPPPLSHPDCRWLLILIVALTPVDRSRTGIPPRDRSALPCNQAVAFAKMSRSIFTRRSSRFNSRISLRSAVIRPSLRRAFVPVGLIHPPHPIATGQHGYRRRLDFLEASRPLRIARRSHSAGLIPASRAASAIFSKDPSGNRRLYDSG